MGRGFPKELNGGIRSHIRFGLGKNFKPTKPICCYKISSNQFHLSRPTELNLIVLVQLSFQFSIFSLKNSSKHHQFLITWLASIEKKNSHHQTQSTKEKTKSSKQHTSYQSETRNQNKPICRNIKSISSIPRKQKSFKLETLPHKNYFSQKKKKSSITLKRNNQNKFKGACVKAFKKNGC